MSAGTAAIATFVSGLREGAATDAAPGAVADTPDDTGKDVASGAPCAVCTATDAGGVEEWSDGAAEAACSAEGAFAFGSTGRGSETVAVSDAGAACNAAE